MKFNQMYRQTMGFTLVELLIVVIVIAILAAIVVPQFQVEQKHAHSAAVSSNLKVLRGAIDLYRLQHGVNPGLKKAFGGGKCTGIEGSGGPRNPLAFVSQLTLYSAQDGRTCDVRSDFYRYGPYLRSRELPVNSATGGNSIIILNNGNRLLQARSGQVLGGADWLFNAGTNDLIANHEDYDHL